MIAADAALWIGRARELGQALNNARQARLRQLAELAYLENPTPVPDDLKTRVTMAKASYNALVFNENDAIAALLDHLGGSP